MNDYNLEELESLERAATPAPWTEFRYNLGDGSFIAALRNAAPALFADLRRLQAENARLLDAFKDMDKASKDNVDDNEQLAIDVMAIVRRCREERA